MKLTDIQKTQRRIAINLGIILNDSLNRSKVYSLPLPPDAIKEVIEAMEKNGYEIY